MDDVGLNPVRPEPAGQPETIAACLKGHSYACNFVPCLSGFAAPTMQQLEQSVFIGGKLLQWLALNAGYDASHKPG